MGLGLTPPGLQIPSTPGVGIWSPGGGWGSIPDQPPNYDGCHSRGRTGKMEFTCLFSRQGKTVRLPKIIRTVCPTDSLQPTR